MCNLCSFYSLIFISKWCSCCVVGKLLTLPKNALYTSEKWGFIGEKKKKSLKANHVALRKKKKKKISSWQLKSALSLDVITTVPMTSIELHSTTLSSDAEKSIETCALQWVFKPIERKWRKFCSVITRSPFFFLCLD